MYLSITLQDTENCNDLTDIVKKLHRLGIKYFDFQLWYDFNILVCKVDENIPAKGLFQLKQIVSVDKWDNAPNGRFYDMNNGLMLLPSTIGLLSHAETIRPLLSKSNLTQEEKDLIIHYGFFVLSKEGELGYWSDLGKARSYLITTLQLSGVTVRKSEIAEKPILRPLDPEVIKYM